MTELRQKMIRAMDLKNFAHHTHDFDQHPPAVDILRL